MRLSDYRTEHLAQVLSGRLQTLPTRVVYPPREPPFVGTGTFELTRDVHNSYVIYVVPDHRTSRLLIHGGSDLRTQVTETLHFGGGEIGIASLNLATEEFLTVTGEAEGHLELSGETTIEFTVIKAAFALGQGAPPRPDET
jgi:hypothetical protein